MVTRITSPDARPDAAAPSLPGYELGERLRHGAGGSTYKGRTTDGRQVIVKVFPADDAAERTRLLRVGERLRRLHHPGLAAVRDCVAEGDTVAWVLEVEAGAPLDEVFAAAPQIGERTLRRLLIHLLNALQALHGAGLIHRDVKPGNVLVRPDGAPVLTDFGAAAEIGEAAAAVDDSLLTPGYAAPEQYEAGGREGPWTDVYGLAAVGWRAVTGERPEDAWVRRRGDAPPAAADVGRGRFDAALLAAIDRALSLDPAARPQTASAFAAALEGAAAGTPPTMPTAADADDGEPTVRIRRRLTPPMPRPEAAAPAAAAPDAPTPARRRRRGWRWLLLPMALALLGVAGWQGWEYYLTHIKSEWVVDAGGRGDTRSIAEALTRAKPTATIYVRPGTYAETLILDRPHRLEGDGAVADIVVLGAGSAPCLTVSAAGAVVRGLTFKGGTSGGGAPAPCVEVTSADAVIDGNAVSSVTGPAVRVSGEAAPLITGNDIGGGPAAGLRIDGAAHPQVTGNAITSKDRSAVIDASTAAPEIAGNRISGAGQDGLLISAGAPIVRDNAIEGSGGSGIEVRGDATATVIQNRIREAKQAGIYVHGAAAGTFEDNVIEGNALSGVVLGTTGDAVFTGNRIVGNGEHGVVTLAGSKGRIEHNSITGNTLHGIAEDVKSEAVIAENETARNGTPQRRRAEVMERPEAQPEPDATPGAGPEDMGAGPTEPPRPPGPEPERSAP